ncbi:peroxiredoxin [Nostoc sp. UIC 10890]
MNESVHLHKLPDDLPIPEDDGSCSHLTGTVLKSVLLPSTSGRDIDLSKLTGRTVVYCYPLTGSPNHQLPNEWDKIPGARGCTPQSCAFRDRYLDISNFVTNLFGLSTQDSDYQREAVERLHLPFQLLSDSGLSFAHSLHLPTFEIESKTLIKRLTLIIENGKIEKVFYPVFPPDLNAEEVLKWLSDNPI